MGEREWCNRMGRIEGGRGRRGIRVRKKGMIEIEREEGTNKNVSWRNL